MLKNLYLLQLFLLTVKCAEVNVTKDSSMNLTNDTNTESLSNSTIADYNTTIPPPEEYYTETCSIHSGCSICEVCVDNQCLPYVVESIYYKNCSLVDHCIEKKCNAGKCVSSYGHYFCECPRSKYGLNCGVTWKSNSKSGFLIKILLETSNF